VCRGHFRAAVLRAKKSCLAREAGACGPDCQTAPPSNTSVLASVIEVIGADTPASLSLESKVLGAFAPSSAGHEAEEPKIRAAEARLEAARRATPVLPLITAARAATARAADLRGDPAPYPADHDAGPRGLSRSRVSPGFVTSVGSRPPDVTHPATLSHPNCAAGTD
jgi:hypothetical protein